LSVRSARTRRTFTILAVLAGAAAAGYIVTCAVFPAPIIPRSIAVPSLRGLPSDSVVNFLATLGLRGRVADTVADSFTGTGTIAWQSPVEGTRLPQGGTVRLGVSRGKPAVMVPDVVEFDQGLAREVIEAAGLIVGHVDTLQQDVDAGTVLSTTPASGSELHPGDTVRVAVSSGPAPVAVPSLMGLTLAAARDRITAAGLRLGALDQRAEGKPGTVLGQRPLAGESAGRESSVDLILGGPSQ
jgi:hypothetical protein